VRLLESTDLLAIFLAGYLLSYFYPLLMKFMKKITLLFYCISLLSSSLLACTNIVVTKGASSNNSNMIVYTCDGEFHPRLKILDAADHEAGDSLNIYNYWGGVVGKIAQVPHTYKVLGYHNMNEHQVAMGETTFGGREELENKDKFLSYWNLMNIALQRATTAREAIKVMTSLVEEYGYASSGETFSICDKDEAWIMEMIGTGTGGEGAVWVAMRIPDGMMTAHANKARIGEFPMKDPENCLHSENVISFAVEKGYFDPASGEPFRFNDVYDPATPANLRYCETRVWSIFRRAAPDQEFSSDYHRGINGAVRYPLFITPDNKIGVQDLMHLIRDHYEGTEFDQTKGLAAGAFGNPNRWRPLVWELEGVEASWERCISTYNTGFSIITQSRNHFRDELGGVVWYGVDDTYFTCYAPVYICTDSVPAAYKKGSLKQFNMSSAWWVFNLVANYCNTKYSYIIKDIQSEQSRIESKFLNQQDSIESIANRSKAGSKLLSMYSYEQLEYMFQEWTTLSGNIIAKYNDGYIQNEQGRPQNAWYPEEWLNRSMQDNSGVKMPEWGNKQKTKEPENH
jgi:dipeptidase